MLLPFAVQEIRTQGFTEESPQLEDMAHFDPFGGIQNVSAAWAKLSRLGQSYISHDICLEVSRVIGSLEMGVRFIGAYHEVAATGDGYIGHPFDVFQTNR